MLTDEQRKELIYQFTSVFSCDASYLAGQTFRALMIEAELAGAIAYWGNWTESQLDTILVEAGENL